MKRTFREFCEAGEGDVVRPSWQSLGAGGERYWAGPGGGASGVLPVCETTKRICLAWRSRRVHQGNCWGTLGGAIAQGLSPEQNALQEVMEETGYAGPVQMTPAYVFVSGQFRYYNFIGIVGEEFGFHPVGKHSRETDRIAWMTYEEVVQQAAAGKCHPGLVALLHNSKDLIERVTGGPVREWSGRLLSEMLVHDLGNDRDRPMFVAWRQHLWVGSSKDIEKHTQEIYRTIIREHPRGTEIATNKYRADPDDIVQWVNEYIADGIVGTYDRATRTINTLNMWHAPLTSPLAMKVARTLRARYYNQGDEETRRFRARQLRGRMPKTVFHGTSTQYFAGIARFGLMPMPDQSNYTSVIHPDKVFFTANKQEAEEHAFHTATGGGAIPQRTLDQEGHENYRRRMSRRYTGHPMVVGFTVPDPSKVVADMDVDRSASRNNYDHPDPADTFFSVDSDKASRHVGIFGYRGRVPASFIRQYLVWSFDQEKWFNLPLEKVPLVLKNIRNNGQDFWGRTLGYHEDER